MAKLEAPYKCDECGSIKQPSNGWSIGVVGANVLSPDMQPMMPQPLFFGGVAVLGWNERLANTPDVSHLCGVECITKFVAKSVSKQ